MKRLDYPANLRDVLNDIQTRTALPTSGNTYGDNKIDSQSASIFLGTTATWPQGVSQTYQNLNSRADKPSTAFDVRGARGVSIQLSAYNMTAGVTTQVLGSNDSVGYVPLWLYNPSTSAFTTQFALTGTGTRASPITMLLVVDKPWFQWLQFQVLTADASTTATGLLTILKRD
jgi:hypothetical protein